MSLMSLGLVRGLVGQALGTLAGMIVVTTDKGLCGGLNTNVLRVVTNKLRELQTASVAVQAVAIGNKGFGFLNRIGAKVVSHVTQLGDKPHLERLIGRAQGQEVHHQLSCAG